MRNLNQDNHDQCIFSTNLGQFFPIFEKGQVRPPPPPSFQLRSCLPREIELIKRNCITNRLTQIQVRSQTFLTASLIGYNKINLNPVS